MSGFVGVRNREAPVTDELLDRLWDPISHRGPDATGRWCDGPMGVAAGVLRVSPESSDEEQPFRHASGALAVFDGRLDNRSEILSSLPSNDLTSRDPDVALVAEAYLAWGDRFPERLNGEYALALLDPKSRRVLLARDVVGTRLLVFGETPAGDVIFASEAKALLSHPSLSSDPNLDVVAEFLLGGNARATPWDSFFTHVRRVPPGVTVLIGTGGTKWRTHDAFDPERRTVHRSYGTYVEEYRGRFIDAVTRRLRSDRPIGLFVSGGLDSSSILAVAATNGAGVDLVPVNLSFPEGSPGNEERYVRELERALGLAVHRVPRTADELVPSAFDQTHILEAPSAPSGWGSRLAVWELMRSHGAKSYLGGSWGDQVLVDQTYLVDLFDRFQWLDVKRHLAQLPEWMTDVDPAWFVRNFIEDVIRWHVPHPLAGVIRRSKTVLRGVQHDAVWYTEDLRARASLPALKPPVGGWSRVPVSPRSLLARLRSLTSDMAISWNATAAAGAGLDDRAPFLDRDLISYVMSVPGEVLTPSGRVRGLHRDAMSGILPETIRVRRDKSDGTLIANEEIEKAGPSIVALFSEAPASGTMRLVQPEVVVSELAAIQGRIVRAEDFREGRAVARVVALETWLQTFM